ncbi:MAG: hypothetical protein AAGE94_09055 [Acidobacteriota bacterium]
MADEFYIGWQEEMPAGHARRVRGLLLALVLVGIGLAIVLAFFQRPFATAFFEFGVTRTFEGTVYTTPSPRLMVDAPGGAAASWSLVGFGKHGAEADLDGIDGERIRLDGTLVYRDDQTMLEVVGGSVERVDGPPRPAGQSVALGRHTVVGEIVDSKCWLGVMKPGAWKPHRACASLCIRGGIPPVLVVRDGGGSPVGHFLLTGSDGRAIHEEILDFVAEPVRVTGEVHVTDDLWHLEIDPSTIERITS